MKEGGTPAGKSPFLYIKQTLTYAILTLLTQDD